MKKLFYLLLAVSFVFAACNSNGKKETKQIEVQPQKTNDMKVVIAAYIDIKPDQVEKFLNEIDAAVDGSRAEEGCISYTLYADTKDTSKFIMFEEWKNQAAVDSHNETVHFKALVALLNEIAAGPLSVKKFSVAE